MYSTTSKTCDKKKAFLQENAHFSQKEAKGYLKIEVIDTGCGISEEGITRLFKPFNQADNKISSKYGGTGLGLYISKRLSNLMDGDI